GGKYGTALQAASFLGILEAVTLLLDHGADPTVEGSKYGTALQAAAVTDLNELSTWSLCLSLDVRPRIVALLLEKGAASNVQGLGLVLTLRRYADMLPAGGRYGTALQAAVATGVDKCAYAIFAEIKFQGKSLKASLKGSRS
ncbi:hypothetical protein DFH08DRAFT_992500, partial [Mycena albidolilacea]